MEKMRRIRVNQNSDALCLLDVWKYVRNVDGSAALTKSLTRLNTMIREHSGYFPTMCRILDDTASFVSFPRGYKGGKCKPQPAFCTRDEFQLALGELNLYFSDVGFGRIQRVGTNSALSSASSILHHISMLLDSFASAFHGLWGTPKKHRAQ